MITQSLRDSEHSRVSAGDGSDLIVNDGAYWLNDAGSGDDTVVLAEAGEQADGFGTFYDHGLVTIRWTSRELEPIRTDFKDSSLGPIHANLTDVARDVNGVSLGAYQMLDPLGDTDTLVNLRAATSGIPR